jgi:hypothetical protein
MFEIKIDGVDQLLKKIDTFGKQLDELQTTMPEALVAWQRDDMKRKSPNMTVETSGDETAASTEIWPHSRLEAQEEQARRHALGLKQGGPATIAPKQPGPARFAPKQHRIRGGGPVPRSRRPILREELKQKLHDRMLTLMTKAMKWP